MWGIRGHQDAIGILQRTLVQDRLSHAYLFAGPSGIGKAAVALALAQAVNCSEPEKPCLQCTSCRRIQASTHADVQILARARAGVTIDQVRELQHDASLKPFEGRYRVFIIDEADSMTREAANALLKTLEEPPEYVLLILVAGDADALPETVRSRCQRIVFMPPSLDDVRAALDEAGMSGPQADEIARLARGRVGWALRAAQDPEALDGRRERLEELMALPGEDLPARMAIAERMATAFGRDRGAVLDELALWAEGWRDLLLVRAGVSEAVLRQDIADSQPTYPLEEVVAFLQRLDATSAALQMGATRRRAGSAARRRTT